MKKSLLIIVPLLICLPQALLWASSLRTVTITWTMSDTYYVKGYKVYYSDNSEMADKIWLENCTEPTENPTNTFTITCKDVDLNSNQAYFFAVAAETTYGCESMSAPRSASPIDNIDSILFLLLK